MMIVLAIRIMLSITAGAACGQVMSRVQSTESFNKALLKDSVIIEGSSLTPTTSTIRVNKAH